MSYHNIEFAIDEGVAVLKFDRPDALNSFTRAMHEEVREVLEQSATDKTVRAILLTGKGRGFCAGQDLNDLTVPPGESPADLGDTVENYYNPLIKRLTTVEKPVVCAVNGVAAGAGANIALACDIVIAARSASFIQSFARLGLVPDSGGTWHLPRLVGMARSKGLAMLGPKVSAEQAEAWGLIWQVVDDEHLMDQALELARHLATQPTRGFALTKQAFAASSVNNLEQQLALEAELMRIAGRTHDYQEGVQAFLEKRTPNYRGE